jgi:hypothetical protein
MEIDILIYNGERDVDKQIVKVAQRSIPENEEKWKAYVKPY